MCNLCFVFKLWVCVYDLAFNNFFYKKHFITGYSFKMYDRCNLPISYMIITLIQYSKSQLHLNTTVHSPWVIQGTVPENRPLKLIFFRSESSIFYRYPYQMTLNTLPRILSFHSILDLTLNTTQYSLNYIP